MAETSLENEYKNLKEGHSFEESAKVAPALMEGLSEEPEEAPSGGEEKKKKKKKKKKGVLEEAEELAGSIIGGLLAGSGGILENAQNTGEHYFGKDSFINRPIYQGGEWFPKERPTIGDDLVKGGEGIKPDSGDPGDEYAYDIAKEIPAYLGSKGFVKGAKSTIGKILQEATRSGVANAASEEQGGSDAAAESFREGALSFLAEEAGSKAGSRAGERVLTADRAKKLKERLKNKTRDYGFSL